MRPSGAQSRWKDYTVERPQFPRENKDRSMSRFHRDLELRLNLLPGESNRPPPQRLEFRCFSGGRAKPIRMLVLNSTEIKMR
jgi:hypothetical protein